MTNPVSAADGSNVGSKAFSARINAKAPSSASCAFCWFVLTVHPTLNGMPERDTETYRAHLVQAHGLQREIQP